MVQEEEEGGRGGGIASKQVRFQGQDAPAKVKFRSDQKQTGKRIRCAVKYNLLYFMVLA